MKQEDKELLLKDLSARLPYGVKVKFKTNGVIENKDNFIYNEDGEYEYITNGKSYLTLDIIKILSNNCIDEIKPYLFPLSSMSEEQKQYLKNRFCYDWDGEPYELWKYQIEIGDADELIDWFHKSHMDYRGLINKGLAINVTGLNIY